MYRIEDFIENLSVEKIAITKHAQFRLEERGIYVDNIVEAIKNGEIIKQYENDSLLPSCLVLGRDENGKPLHLVLSRDSDFIYLVTAYRPSEAVWESDFRTKKGGEK